MKVLITGGAGFVGANLAIALKESFENCEVLALDNLYRKGSGLNLPRLKSRGVKFIRGDVRNPEDIETAAGADFLVECSAEPSVLAGKDGGTDYLVGTNLYGAVNCAEFCRRHGTSMIFLSTSRVYPIAPLLKCAIRKGRRRFDFAEKQNVQGLSPKGVSENFPMHGPRSLYGATKYAAETVLLDYADAFGFKLVIDRFGVIAGPWQFGKADQGIAPFWLAAHLFGKKLDYIGFDGKGRQVRDFLHVDDATRLIIMQMRNPAKFAVSGNGFDGRIFNAGGGRDNSASLLELTDLCREVSGRKVEIGSVPETRYADIPIYISDSSRLQSTCAWRPRKNILRILQDIHGWIAGNPEAKAVFK